MRLLHGLAGVGTTWRFAVSGFMVQDSEIAGSQTSYGTVAVERKVSKAVTRLVSGFICFSENGYSFD